MLPIYDVAFIHSNGHRPMPGSRVYILDVAQLVDTKDWGQASLLLASHHQQLLG